MVAIIAASVGMGIFSSSHKTEKGKSLLTLANIDALTRIEIILGKPYIIDEIPCESKAEEVRLDCSYVNCSTCQSEKGQGTGNAGTCTSVREFTPTI